MIKDGYIKGHTLVELVIVIVAVSVMAVGAVVFFIPLANLFFVSPRQAAVEYIGQDILDIIIEGDSKAKGLKFSKAISAASATQITYIDADAKTVVIRWDQATLKFYRNINSAGEVVVPKVYTGGTRIQGKTTANVIFRFFDASGAEISSPVAAGSLLSVKRIKMEISVYTGGGLIKNFDGKVNLTTGTEIKVFS